MEAGNKVRRLVGAIALAIGINLAVTTAFAANYRTQNFLIQAPSAQLAQAVGEAAEEYRRELAVHWLGRPIPPWDVPCPVRVIAGPNLAAQGVTTYNRAPVRDFQMEVVGTPERILDSVLPHEVTHTVLATHFGRPLPRWADEGICTTVEHASERSKHEAKLREFLASRRGIAMNRMFLLTEYPADVLPLYAQGYSVCRFLIEQKGPEAFIDFLEGYMQRPSWTDNVREHYGYHSLAELQEYWLAWVEAGSGSVGEFVKSSDAQPAEEALASRSDSREPNRPSATPVSQSSSQPQPTALASLSSGDGWYLRRKQGRDRNLRSTDAVAAAEADAVWGPEEDLRGPAAMPVAQHSGGSSTSVTDIPPSVRQSGRYSAAQPQPEQSMSSTPISRSPSSGAGDRRPTSGGASISSAAATHLWR